MDQFKCVQIALKVSMLSIFFLITVSANGDGMGTRRRVPISPVLLAASALGRELECDAARDLHAGDYVAAEAQAREAVNAFSTADMGYNIIGQSLEGQKKYAEALAAYSNDVAAVNGGFTGQQEHLFRYAQMLLIEGDWKDALLAYSSSLGVKPNGLGEVRTPSGDLFNLNSPDPGQLAVAIHIERAVLDSEFSDIAGEPLDKEAIEQYSAALAIDPASPRANYGLGLVLKSLGRLDEAKAAFRKGLEAADGEMKANIEFQLGR